MKKLLLALIVGMTLSFSAKSQTEVSIVSEQDTIVQVTEDSLEFYYLAKKLILSSGNFVVDTTNVFRSDSSGMAGYLSARASDAMNFYAAQVRSVLTAFDNVGRYAYFNGLFSAVEDSITLAQYRSQESFSSTWDGRFVLIENGVRTVLTSSISANGVIRLKDGSNAINYIMTPFNNNYFRVRISNTSYEFFYVKDVVTNRGNTIRVFQDKPSLTGESQYRINFIPN